MLLGFSNFVTNRVAQKVNALPVSFFIYTLDQIRSLLRESKIRFDFHIISKIKWNRMIFSKLWLRIFKKLKNSLIINSYAWLVTPQYLFNYRFIFSLKSYGTSHEKNISGIFCMVETFILYRSFFNWRIYCFATRYYHTVQPKNRTLVGIFLRLSLL